jgi:hypothetical protein
MIKPIIDADAEQLDRITDEIIKVWAEIRKIEKKHLELVKEESRSLEYRMAELYIQRRRFEPKPRCFGRFSTMVEQRGALCEGCNHAAACYKAERLDGGVHQ